MTFGALPFLLAGLAAAIPVVLHMIHRQKVKDLPFPTLRFLRISVNKTRRRKRVHDLFLMLLRMAVLILIAIGLARPTLTNLTSLWGGGGSAVAIILDNSASMGTVDQGPDQERVRFRTALSAAEQIMDELRDGDQVVLLVTGGPEFPEQGKLDPTHAKVRQMLSQWINSPSDTGGLSYEQADLAMEVQQARKLLAESDAEDKQIYVLTDLQRLSWESLENDPLPKGEGTDIPDIPIIFVDCNRGPKPNVAITGVSLTSAVPIAGQPITATVELFNAASVAQQRHVELLVDGTKKQSSSALDIPPGGRLRHEITFAFDRGGLHRGEVRLAGKDGCELDDRRFFTMEVDQGIPVAVVKPRRHEIPYLEDTFYVEQALSSGKSGQWAIRTTVLTAQDLPSESLSKFKVVFCVNLRAPQGEAAERLRAYVAGGGNLVWFCGDNVQAEAYNRMNQEAREQLLPLPLLGVHTAGVDEDRDSWNIGFLDKQHPALSHLVEPAALYRSVLIYKHMRMDEAAVADERVMARLNDEKGEPLLVQRNVGEGKVLLLGTSAHIGWSNMPLRPIFLPLLARLVFDLAGAEQARHQTLAGSPLVLPLEDQAGSVGSEEGMVEVLLPTGDTVRPEIENQGEISKRVFRYEDTHEIGIYQLNLLPPARPRQIAYSVNVDPDESDPTKIERVELQARFGRTPLVFAEDPDDLSGTFAWLREGKSLWGLFLSGVLIALVFETFVSNRLSPKQEQDQAEQLPPGMRRLAKKARGAA